MIGRSAPFARFLSKELKKSGREAKPEEILRHLNRVQTSYIRTESDEITYNLHIALRFQIEEELIQGKLEVKDIPARWNQEFSQSFGLNVTDDSVGCMQDIHWFGGAFGYFPTYSLGNLFAAELFFEMVKAIPSWEQKVEAGEFESILEFLRTRVHQQGSAQNSPATIQAALGRSLGQEAFARYATEKYLNNIQ
jgi:carboxypeptidase Taq